MIAGEYTQHLDELTGRFRLLPWRVGRRVARNIYAVVGPGPSDADIPIGALDSPVLAEEAVNAHNERIGVRGRG